MVCLCGELGMKAGLFNVHGREEGICRTFKNDRADTLSIIRCFGTFANQSTETWGGWEVQWLQDLSMEEACPSVTQELSFSHVLGNLGLLVLLFIMDTSVIPPQS